jgi:hypothetical protein
VASSAQAGEQRWQEQQWQEEQITAALELVAMLVHTVAGYYGISLSRVDTDDGRRSSEVRRLGRDQRWRGSPW